MMDHPIRFHIGVNQDHHAKLQLAAKRAGISMSKLIELGIADLLTRIEREGAVTVPLRPSSEVAA